MTGPPPERQQHDRVSRDEQTIADAAGAIGLPYRVEGLLGRLERHGDIGHGEAQAGEQFHRLFQLAHLDALRAADMGQGAASRWQPPGSEWARQELNRALDALGGLASPCGACAWYVLGCEYSLREWAMRQGWSGRPIRQEVAKGTLIGTLGVLVRHFGT